MHRYKPWKEFSSVKGTDIHSMWGMKYVKPSNHVSPRMQSKEKEPAKGDDQAVKKKEQASHCCTADVCLRQSVNQPYN